MSVNFNQKLNRKGDAYQQKSFACPIRNTQSFPTIKYAPRGLDPAPKRESPRSAQRRPTLPQPGAAVLSAMEGLTAGFGMGPGVPPPPWSLGRPGALACAGTLAACIAGKRFASAYRMMSRRARPISTARLRRSRALQLRPIHLVFYKGPYRREISSRGRLPA